MVAGGDPGFPVCWHIPRIEWAIRPACHPARLTRITTAHSPFPVLPVLPCYRQGGGFAAAYGSDYSRHARCAVAMLGRYHHRGSAPAASDDGVSLHE